MRVLIVQLSDIHFRGTDDPVLSKAGRIVDAVRGLDYHVSACVVVLSGDITFGGKEDEFLVALEFVDELKQRLTSELANEVPVHVVAVPGNHDCDLIPERSIRTTLIEHIANHGDDIDDSVIDLCTEVQAEFFQFRDAAANHNLQYGDSRLFYEYRFHARGASVAFRCYNTAWMSRIPEREGTLVFPNSRAQKGPSGGDVVVAVLHHPYRWFTQENYRRFRDLVQESCDLVLTGHEHVPGRYLQHSSRGETNQYIEGVALQELADSDASGFNALIIDTETKRQRFYPFVWTGNLYAPLVADGSTESEWEDFQLNRLRTRESFEVTQPFMQFLEDPGAGLTHPKRDSLRLSDLFIPPDLREVRVRPNEVWPLVRGETLFQPPTDASHILITGPELCGKTALAKQLFLFLHSQGYVPLFVHGAKFRATDDHRTIDALYDLFTEEYGPRRLEQYRQLDRTRRVLIIDDIHALRTKDRVSIDAVLGLLNQFAGRLLLFANDLKHQLDQLVDPDRGVNGQIVVTHLRMQQFGHAKRDALVDRWFSLAPDPGDDAEFAAEVLAAKHALEVVIGKNYVPAYPLFIFSILQARSAATALNLNASTYGYFYEILIKNALAVGSNKIKFDIKTAFLTHLAWTMHVRGQAEIAENELRSIYDGFLHRKALARPFAEMRDDLVQALILGRLGDQYWFKYKYVFYYFVASHLRDTIGNADTKEEISKLSQQLQDEDSANILLFLAHVSKDPFIVQELLRNAKAVFTEYEPARIREDMAFLTTPDTSLITIEYEERDVRVSRRELLERVDKAEEEDGQSVSGKLEGAGQKGGDALEWQAAWIAKLSNAFKTLQILGQILKNFPGSLDAEEKEAIARECYLLGLRTLSAVTSLARDHQPSLIQYFIEIVREGNPAYSSRSLDLFERQDLLIKANEAIFGLVLGATYGTIQRIAYAVGSPDLELTYAAVLTEGKSDAFALVDAAVKLDHFATFPLAAVVDLGKRLKGAPLASSVLRHLVVNHFYLFPVDLPIRQRACEALSIPIKRVTGRNPSIKLIAPPGRKT